MIRSIFFVNLDNCGLQLMKNLFLRKCEYYIKPMEKKEMYI